MDSKTREFLKELSELSAKHGLYIDSCGDCDSMWVTPVGEASGESIMSGVTFDPSDRTYKHRDNVDYEATFGAYEP